ncbi:MAG: hypothetical protein RIB80_08765 [Rhodospirillales bacterium]
MTLPSEGINPWRVAPAPGGHSAPPAKASPAHLPDLKVNPGESLSPAKQPASGGKEFKAFGDDGMTFLDLVDVVNPLQHIPVVSTLYRDLTGDTLDPAPRIMGGTLFMGPIGLVASVANVMVEHNTGKDMGGHVLAYFRDDAEPLTTRTAAATPAAAGTDGTDPVTAWAAEQNAFYRDGQNTGDPVTAWAAGQQAFYRGQTNQAAAQTATADPVSDWAQAQHAYYRGDAPKGSAPTIQTAQAAGPVAAGTDGVDVTQWAAQQVAHYHSSGTANQTTDTVSQWARSQNAYYRAGAEPGAVQTASNHDAAPSAAGTDGLNVSQWAAGQVAYYQDDATPATAADPVSAWAARQTAFYQDNDRAAPRAASQTDSVQTARATAARPDGAEDVSAWARDQLAWVMGDRAKEVAALPSAAPASGSTRDRDDAPVGRNINAASNTANASGAVADGGGWFRDNMVQGWTRYQAAQRLAEPGYRPDLGLAAGTR